MQVESHYTNNRTTTFIVADNEREADELVDIAPQNVPLVAIIEPQGHWLFPYLKIIYEGRV